MTSSASFQAQMMALSMPRFRLLMFSDFPQCYPHFMRVAKIDDTSNDGQKKVLYLVCAFLQSVAARLCSATNLRTHLTPRGELVTLVLDPELFSMTHTGAHTLMHGTTVWNAWHIWRQGFRVGRNGHAKNGSTRNGIWGFEGGGDSVDYAMNRADASSNPSMRKGEFDAWSCPCVLEFRFPVELTRFPDTQAGVRCLTHNGRDHQYRPGDIIDVKPYWAAVHINVDVFRRYNDFLAAQSVRGNILHGRSIMCSAPWLSCPQERDCIVNPDRNPCGRVVDARDLWMHFQKRGKCWYCAECACAM